MDMLSEIYAKSADANEKNLNFWENYLQNLKNLDFSIYSDKLKVPVLVPIGSRISFRGELKHTNEVTVALGADYFVKCSIKQAEVLLQRRIKDAHSNIEIYKKEQKYLESQVSFTQTAFNDHGGKEIIEYYSEEDDKAWRQAHRENVKKYKQNKGKEEKAQGEEITDEELWDRLEELELQEELTNELSYIQDENIDKQHITKTKTELKVNDLEHDIKIKNKTEETNQEKTDNDQEKSVSFKEKLKLKTKTPEQTSNSDRLQQVIDKQIELEKLIYEVRSKARVQNKNTADLLARLDELEQLDELEDELDRLSDIIDNEEVDDEEEDDDDDDDDEDTQAPKLQRRVSFVDEDDSNTLEITFKHSPIDSNNQPYNPTEGIQKPSDIYEAHSKNFENGTTSILKKSKYEIVTEKSDTKIPRVKVVQFDAQDRQELETVVIQDVVEKVNQADPKVLSQARPTSLFKKKRMQNKS